MIKIIPSIKKIITFSDSKYGKLSVFDDKSLNFMIKRIYYIHGVKANQSRGYHAHKNLEQIAWCPHGSIEILLDNGNATALFLLDSPEKALKIGPGIWREMKWLKSNSVLCVAASEHYDEDDYVRNYDKFLQMVNEGYWNEK